MRISVERQMGVTDTVQTIYVGNKNVWFYEQTFGKYLSRKLRKDVNFFRSMAVFILQTFNASERTKSFGALLKTN